MLTPHGSPASSTPNTPRKSPRSESIAQEKARLKKLEHELSEKLKMYGRQEEEGKNSSSLSSDKPSQNNKDSSEQEEKQPVGSSSDNSSLTFSERQDQFVDNEKAVVLSEDSKTPDAVELNVNAQQLERIRKLQVSNVG